MSAEKSSKQTEVVYAGQALHSLDDSRRVMIPSRWRSAEKNFWAIPWPIGKRDCLMVVPEPRFKKTLDTLKGKSLADKAAAAVQRVIGGTAQRLTLDSANRLLLPESLTGEVGISGEVKFIGLTDRFEIWEPGRLKTATVADEAIAAEAVVNMDL